MCVYLTTFHLLGLSPPPDFSLIDTLYSQCLGHADLSTSTPITPSTLFKTGSTTKAFTAAALGLLITSKNYSFPSPRSGTARLPLSWRTPISALLPGDFVVAHPWATDHLTLEDAVVHRTGLPRHDKSSGRFYPSTGGELHTAAALDIVRSVRHLPLAGEPREVFRYCNIMYVVLAACVEAVVGKTLGEVLRESIWGPLGMGETFYGAEDLGRRGDGRELTEGYYWDKDAEELREIAQNPQPELAGAAIVISSVRDYARWLTCLLQRDQPLGSALHEELWTPKMVDGGGISGGFDGPTMYASGWGVGVYKGRRVVSHNGLVEAFGANVVFFPDDGFGIVTMGNTAIEGNAVGEILLWRLVDERFRVAKEKRFDWGKK